MPKQSPETHDDELRTNPTTSEKETVKPKPTTSGEKEEDPWIGKSQVQEKP